VEKAGALVVEEMRGLIHRESDPVGADGDRGSAVGIDRREGEREGALRRQSVLTIRGRRQGNPG